MKERIDCHIGGRLRARREELGVSAVGFAAALQIGEDELALMESGDVRVGAFLLQRAAEILNVSVVYFFDEWQVSEAPRAPVFHRRGLH